MLEKLKDWVQQAAKAEPLDISQFNDPLAATVDWTPLKRGGSNFHTHRLIAVDNHRVEFRPTFGAKLFAGIFIAAGIGFPLLIHITDFYSSDSGSPEAMPYIWLFGMIFAGVGAAFYYFTAKPRIFDKWTGMYWKGFKKPDHNHKPEDTRQGIMLSHIHAVQLIREYVRGDKSSYYSYELNLVLKTGHRINVVDHGKKTEIIEDARKLSEFLDKPVWNAFEGI